MPNADYTDFLEGIVAAAGALTGLLFVALSVTPDRGTAGTPAVIRQVRAAAALLAFLDPLSVALFSLIPNARSGWPATVVGLIGLAFTAAGMRSILSDPETRGWRGRQISLIALLVAIFGVTTFAGVRLIAQPGSQEFADILCYCMTASLIVGVARAWELVGDRDTGLFASLAVLAGHEEAAHHNTPAKD